jgi:hypothetical protein
VLFQGIGIPNLPNKMMPFSFEQACYINIEKSLQASADKEYDSFLNRM